MIKATLEKGGFQAGCARSAPGSRSTPTSDLELPPQSPGDVSDQAIQDMSLGGSQGSQRKYTHTGWQQPPRTQTGHKHALLKSRHAQAKAHGSGSESAAWSLSSLPESSTAQSTPPLTAQRPCERHFEGTPETIPLPPVISQGLGSEKLCPSQLITRKP